MLKIIWIYLSFTMRTFLLWVEKGPTVTVGVKYNGEQLWGRGKDYLWVDAFANVQKQLPNDVLLKCCLTCRHGNMCPYGNEPGKLFCTKGLIVGSKEDMCNLFDDQENSKIFDRIKSVADSCNEYTPQSDDYYTYNDYLYRLEKWYLNRWNLPERKYSPKGGYFFYRYGGRSAVKRPLPFRFNSAKDYTVLFSVIFTSFMCVCLCIIVNEIIDFYQKSPYNFVTVNKQI